MSPLVLGGGGTDSFPPSFCSPVEIASAKQMFALAEKKEQANDLALMEKEGGIVCTKD